MSRSLTLSADSRTLKPDASTRSAAIAGMRSQAMLQSGDDCSARRITAMATTCIEK